MLTFLVHWIEKYFDFNFLVSSQNDTVLTICQMLIHPRFISRVFTHQQCQDIAYTLDYKNYTGYLIKDLWRRKVFWHNVCSLCIEVSRHIDVYKYYPSTSTSSLLQIHVCTQSYMKTLNCVLTCIYDSTGLHLQHCNI